MKKLFFLLIILPALSGCKKEETLNVLYRIGTDGSVPAFTVRYTLPDGSTKSQGPMTSGWSSGKLEGYERGDALSLTLESTGGDFTMYILINGFVDAERAAGGTGGSQTLTTYIND